MKYYVITSKPEIRDLISLSDIESVVCIHEYIEQFMLDERKLGKALILSVDYLNEANFCGSEEKIVNRIRYDEIMIKVLSILDIRNDKYVIYCATSPSDKKYIGQTTNNIIQRIRKHYYTALVKGEVTAFTRALKRYLYNFKWSILEKVETKEELNEAERKWISFYNSCKKGYNLTEGGPGFKGMHHALETKMKISRRRKGRPTWNRGLPGKKWSEDRKRWISSINKGRKPTANMLAALAKRNASGFQSDPEIRKKIGDAIRGNPVFQSEEFKKTMSEVTSGDKNGMYGKNHSEDARDKMKKACNERWKDSNFKDKFKQCKSKFEIVGPDGTIYINDREAAIKSGLPRCRIQKMCKEGDKGWIRRYKDKNEVEDDSE